jgi:amino acid transporter
MMDLLDYLYYRFANAYYKWDGKSGITGIMAVALFISLLFIDILGIIYFSTFTYDFRIQNKETAKIVGVVVIGIVFFFSFRRYKNNFSIYDERWRNEDRNERFKKGILIVLLMILPIIIPIIFLNALN